MVNYGKDPVEDLNNAQSYGASIQEFVDKHIDLEDPLSEYFPFQYINRVSEIKHMNGRGCCGVVGIARSAGIPQALNHRPKPELYMDKFVYLLTNDDLEKNNDLVSQHNSLANTFFAEALIWKRLKALGTGAGMTITASGYWSTTDPEANIAEAIALIKDYGWKSAWGKILCIYPARVDMEFKKARIFRGRYDTVASIIKQSYPEVEFISYVPLGAANDSLEIDIQGGTDSDALGNDCLVTVAQPSRVLESKQDTFKSTPSVFVKQISDVGIQTILRRKNACMVKPWMSTSDAAIKNPLIVKINGVAAAR